MAVQLNHTIVAVRDKRISATFLAEILGLATPAPVGPFMCVETANGVSLAYDDRGGRSRATTLSWSARRSSTPSSPASGSAGCGTGPIRGTRRRTRSTTTGAVSTSKTHRATTWRY